MSQTQTQSQSQSQFSHSQDPNRTTISFAKFSHVTSAIGVKTFTWTHVGEREDLDLIFCSARQVDSHGNLAERLLMKVAAGAELLESQDLGDLVRIWMQFDAANGGDSPIQVVVKCPFLAMRYPKTNTSIRRVQFKFRNETDFHRALSTLTDLGLPVTQNAPSTQPSGRALVSPAPLMGPPTPVPSSAGSMQGSYPRPGSTSSYFSSSSEGTMKESLSSPIKSSFKAPSPLNHSTFSAQCSVGGLSYITPSMPRPLSASSLPRDSLYISQTEKEMRRVSSPNLQESLANAPSQFRQPHPSSEQMVRTQSASPYFSHRGSMMGQASSADDPFTQNTSQSFNIPARVRSVPIAETFDSGRFAIPPRRVLPFAKAKPKEKVTLPKPAPTKDIEPTAPGCATPTRKPAKKRAAQRKPSVAKAQENGFATNTFAAATLDDLPSPLAIKKSTEATPKVTATKKRATPVSRPSSASKRPKMVDAGTQTQTPSGCDQSVQTIPPPTKAPELVKNVSTPPSPESPPEHYLDGVDKFVSKFSARSTPRELWQTPGYAEASEEERDAILNDYICENLENPDFIKLCEDTERAWRRIGL